MNFKKLSKILCITSILIMITISCSLGMTEDLIGEKSSTSSVQEGSDKDLVPDDIEKIFGTDPGNVDTDGDGMWDGYEIVCGTPNGGWQDPLVYNERYAVLFVGGVNSDNNHANYWNELVMTYDTLIEGYGYKPENVFVFYADGDTPNKNNMIAEKPYYSLYLVKPRSIKSHKSMIDFDAQRDTLVNFLEYDLKPIITENDSLFFWVYDHGTEVLDTYAAICCWKSVLFDYELYDSLKDFNYAQATFALGMCYSGGFLDPGKVTNTSLNKDKDSFNNLNDLPGNIIVMTSQDARTSHSFYNLGFLFRLHQGISPRSFWGKPSFWSLMTKTAWYSIGICTLTTPDRDRNRFISMREAFEFAKDNDLFSTETFTGTYLVPYFDDSANYGDVPQYYESSPGLGDKTYL